MGTWTRQHEQRREEILSLLADRVQPFPADQMTASAQKRRRALPLDQWLLTYLPHYCEHPFEPFHRSMMAAAAMPDLPTFVCAFRGAGKSVLLALGRPLWKTLRQEVPFWIYGSMARSLAAQTMDYLRLELEHNERIRCDYPHATVDGAEDAWVVDFGGARAPDGTMRYDACRFEAHGVHTSPRGHRFRQHRPHAFIGDDLETLELARSPDRERHLWQWLFKTVEPALEPELYEWTVLCNMFGVDCLFERARRRATERDSEGRELLRVFAQPALDAEGHSVWPAKYSDQALERKRLRGGLTTWLHEYMLEPDDPDKPFQPKWIDAVRYDPERLDVGRLDVVAFLDPALSVSSKGCPRALVVVGADRQAGTRYVLDARIGRGSPGQMVDWLFGAFEAWKPRIIGIEANGGYALLRPLVEERMRRSQWIPVTYVDHSEAKATRIERLQPAFEAGRWRFPRTPGSHVQTLEAQFWSYPDGWIDGPDAASGCDELLPNAFRSSGQTHYRSEAGRREEVASLL